MKFKDKVAIITGGSKGIGFGIAERLASEGVKVYLIARTRENLEKAKRMIEEVEGSVEIYSIDITEKGKVEGIIDEVYEKERRLDIFVNNAGTYKPSSIDSDFSEIEYILNLDMIAPFRITHYLTRKFMKEKRNNLRILTIVSQAGLMAFNNGLAYGTAKMGLKDGLFHFEKEIKDKGINNISLYRIYPGTVGTDSVLELVREGKLQNPASLESVVDLSIDLLSGKVSSRDVYIGYIPGEGIKRIYYSLNLNADQNNPNLLVKTGEKIVDSDFRLE